MDIYNVIGYHDDTGETFADLIYAEDAHEAMLKLARKLDHQGAPDAWIVGAVQTDIYLETQDNGAVVSISDLIEGDEPEPANCAKCGMLFTHPPIEEYVDGTLWRYCSEDCRDKH